MAEYILGVGRKIIPAKIFRAGRPIYHYLLAFFGALYYGFPSRKIFVVAVTGTKGKTTVTEIINKILEEAGHKTALSNTIHFKIANKEKRNFFKMTMPGRFFMQKFLYDAINAKCKYAVVEMTSEGVKQFRHKFIELDALIFTNIAPEHIEAHGSFENYLNAKLKLAYSLEKSRKKNKIMVANIDDKYGPKFLDIKIDKKTAFSLANAKPYAATETETNLTIDGKEIKSKLVGEFNIYNILAAAGFAKSQNISIDTIKNALEKFEGAPGRVERIEEGQDFTVIVDYAHTKESLEELYKAFGKSEKICVLGNTGGGRDRWKRPEMGKIAEKYCKHIILTNEDPYDEDPMQIVKDMAEGITKRQPEIIIDRKSAIQKALSLACRDDVVLITGKGTDPFIMEANGKRIPWSDADVAREELGNLNND
jgi:UDP-N-acetylmuramoyl-L-alanyl-D-glutamate--2,6-diaminopimelate ligase